MRGGAKHSPFLRNTWYRKCRRTGNIAHVSAEIREKRAAGKSLRRISNRCRSVGNRAAEREENTHLNALDRGLPAPATRNYLVKPAMHVPGLAPRSNTAEVLKIMRESPRESPEHPKSEITGHGKSTFSNAAYRFSLRLWDPTAFLKTLIDKLHWQNLQLLGII